MAVPVERTTRYVTSVSELPDAWAFVMSYVDKVGPNPTIRIEPKWIIPIAAMGDEDYRSERQFEVLVEGMIEVEGETD